MRKISAQLIEDAVREMCVRANCVLPEDVRECITAGMEKEQWPAAKTALKHIIENFEIAQREQMPICQDTGVTCVFVEMGQDVLVEGDLSEAINEGVRQGSKEGFLRASIVADPLRRKNTGDNAPAMIYYDIIPGDKLKITVAPKGFGSENMSKVIMLKPSDGVEGVKSFVLKTVEEAGPNPCPPIIVGVGIGGTFDKAALLAKKALMRPANDINPDPFYSELEDELLRSINELGIGPQGFGGKTTALAVKVGVMPTHIAGLPVAVNINCHVTRHVTREIKH
ncbi:MAG: fumarate hydratase [Oscillospiraceae bacterium]|nr:fumarate hydratase [Oscillospiraceae bacterium]